MNAYELMKEMISIETEVEKLMNLKKKSREQWIDKDIDRCLSRQLEIKHILEILEIVI